jgi:hypothetical protein
MCEGCSHRRLLAPVRWRASCSCRAGPSETMDTCGHKRLKLAGTAGSAAARTRTTRQLGAAASAWLAAQCSAGASWRLRTSAALQQLLRSGSGCWVLLHEQPNALTLLRDARRLRVVSPAVGCMCGYVWSLVQHCDTSQAGVCPGLHQERCMRIMSPARHVAPVRTRCLAVVHSRWRVSYWEGGLKLSRKC